MNQVNQKRKNQDNVESLQFSNEVAPFHMISKKRKCLQLIQNRIKHINFTFIFDHQSYLLLFPLNVQEIHYFDLHNEEECILKEDKLFKIELYLIIIFYQIVKKSGRLVIEMKVDKKWVGTSQSLHESLTLINQSQGQGLIHNNANGFLNHSMNQSDIMLGVSEIANQCTFIKEEFDQDNNVVKLYMQPNKNFDYEKTYTTPSNIDIKSTQYTDNDSIQQYDQQIGTSCFYFNDQNIQVGNMNCNDEGM